MPTKKDYIQSHKQIIENYQKQLKTGSSCKNWDCPLCEIAIDCRRCTQYFNAAINCTNMLTYPYYPYGQKSLQLRIEYHKETIKILKNLPEYRFKLPLEDPTLPTFPELWTLDRRLAHENGEFSR